MVHYYDFEDRIQTCADGYVPFDSKCIMLGGTISFLISSQVCIINNGCIYFSGTMWIDSWVVLIVNNWVINSFLGYCWMCDGEIS